MQRVIVLICLLMGCLWFTPAAHAASDFYCSATILVDGEGTAAKPWMCVTVDQFNAHVAEVCRAGGGTLYFLFEGGYVNYTVNHDCSVISGAPNPGSPGPVTPPAAGATLPQPWLMTMAIVAAGGLVAAGLVLRRARVPRT